VALFLSVEMGTLSKAPLLLSAYGATRTLRSYMKFMYLSTYSRNNVKYFAAYFPINEFPGKSSGSFVSMPVKDVLAETLCSNILGTGTGTST
jgi:hypothetical protein